MVSCFLVCFFFKSSLKVIGLIGKEWNGSLQQENYNETLLYCPLEENVSIIHNKAFCDLCGVSL